MKKVLITGATGFLGSHVVPLLREASFDVSAIVRGTRSCGKDIHEIVADLTNGKEMKSIETRMNDIDILIHLAAEMPKAGSSKEEQETLQTTQTEGLRHLLSILPPKIKHIVYASSIDVFGMPKSLPIDETHSTEPISEYGKAKIQGERILQEFADRTGCALTILRITQIYGKGEPKIKAIPLFIEKVAMGEAPVLFGDGSDERDYIEVSDAARSIMHALEHGANGTFVIASGNTVTLKTVAEEIVRISGKKLELISKERQKPKINFRFDVSKAKKLLGFEAKIPLSEGLQMQYDASLRQMQ